MYCICVMHLIPTYIEVKLYLRKEADLPTLIVTM